MPSAEDLALIAIEAAGVARRLGYEPRVAMLAFSNFGHPPGERSLKVQEAVRLLDRRRVDFEYDGEMAADVALNQALMTSLSVLPPVGHRQCSGNAGLSFGLDRHQNAAGTGRRDRYRPDDRWSRQAVQIVPLGAKDSDIVNMAALAAFNIGG